MARRDIFLQIDGVDGESRDDRKINQIELDTITISGANSGTPFQSTKPKVSLGPVVVTKQVDKSSPNLFASLCNGQSFKATITVRKAGGEPVDYLKIELKNCMVTNYHLDVHDNSLPVESVSLTYGQIQYSYWTQDAKGSLGPVIQKSYNLQNNVLS
jgi:type VI secretion system secreted protein Hcp